MANETTIVALFNDRADAERARAALMDMQIEASRVNITSSRDDMSDRGAEHRDEDKGFFEKLKDFFMPDSDRDLYAEGIRRGGCLLSVRIEEQDQDRITETIERFDPVDVEERERHWREAGWAGYRSDAAPFSDEEAIAERERYRVAAGGLSSPEAREGSGLQAGQEQRIPVAEEEMRVGKREVSRGGLRVRSYVTERPVEQDVRLRDENVSVERQPVQGRDGRVGDDAFQERTVEMTETDEEAVADKVAHLKEEVVLRKDANERTERISDKVRETHVDVERIPERERSRDELPKAARTPGNQSPSNQGPSQGPGRPRRS